ncbi:MAG: tRNA-dihydrouridine synthase family protein [Phycisphaerales bacterium]|nr:tRNA-dihydrouridine synthase family protein [Planctomycetota bacterium]MCH8509723.1 tRNA-dihydrouridine synthase family protein [Phycisphaerales bacterium]
MGCQSNNATPPTFAVADGAQEIDPRKVAEDLVHRHGPGGMDPRVRAVIPEWDAPFFQAGLAGYSDAPMRIIARRHGCPICVTEALLDRTLLAGGRGFAKADLGDIEDNIPGGEEDHPLIGQIMGSEPAEMAAAAVKMVEQGRRGDKEYRKAAYKDQPPDWFREKLRLPGGEQLSGKGLATSHQGQGEDPEDSAAGTLVASGQSLVPSPRSFAAVDINLACPVKKISTKSRGGHWLTDPAGAIELLEAVREALPAEVPVTVKLRRSFDDTQEMVDNLHRIFDAAYDMGCAWVTVHGRTVEQKYVGPSRWDPLRELVQRRPNHPVFGSGDVWDVNQIFRMIAYTGVAGASVARGCIGNPWIFRQARDLLEGREPRKPTIAEQRSVLEQHFELALAANRGMRHPELHTGKTMRKFGLRFAEHHPRGDEVRQAFIRVASLEDWRGVLEGWYGADT